MTNKLVWRCIFLLCMAYSSISAAANVVNHQLHVRLNPAEQTLWVRDTIQLPKGSTFRFYLHAGLEPHIISPAAELIQTGIKRSEVSLESYQVTLPEGAGNFTLEYQGKIAHKFYSRTESPGRQQQVLSGTISSNGVFLDASVGWYPVFSGNLQTFTLSVELPGGWYAVSQGAGPQVTSHPTGRKVTWKETMPQDDIYLVAAPYHFYSRSGDPVQAQVFLRQPDPDLAERYLDATQFYLKLYQELIGPYAYSKFALVENFWETGYGMPSFTLLGSRVIRFPFILHTSYPHEILHNWWGNSVYIDYVSGNWSEGLTSYLADHLLKEQRGKGVDYRRSALQRYSHFVRSENDFPIRDFRSRHSSSSQAVGYDKSLMLFHMLRRKLGDENFITGLRHFYQQNLFKTAGFSDLQQAFEAVSKLDLSSFFQQWQQRKGAPALAVNDVQITPIDTGYRLSGTLIQTQSGDAFALEVPLIIYHEAEPGVKQTLLPMVSKSQAFSIDLAGKPLQLDIDPWFDIFRELHPDEAPITLGKVFGSSKILFVLPAAASEELLTGYQAMARQWSEGYGDVSIVLDNELEALPDDRAIWLMGWENQFLPRFQEQLDHTQHIEDEGNGIMLSIQAIRRAEQSLILINQTQNTHQIRAWIGTGNPASLPGLARKVPHYGKYSYLVFSGDQPDILRKGQWPVRKSPLRLTFSDAPLAINELKPDPLW